VRATARHLFHAGLAAALWAVSGGAAAASAQANGQGGAAPSSALLIFQRATESARAAFPRLAGAQPRVVPGSAQYQTALARLQAGQYAEAFMPMREAVRLNSTSALYHGDLAVVYGGLDRWDEAAIELVLARNSQGENQWYTVALAAVKAMRQQWMDAAANLDAAVAADSGIIDSVVAESAVQWSWRARRNQQMMAWAQLATQRYPGTAEPWLRMANWYQQQRDTTRGAAAIRRYVALRPEDHTGQFLFSVFLFDLGQNDSALAFAAEAAVDTANRERASQVMFGVGARMLLAGRHDTAAVVLARALEGAAAELRPRVSLFLGHAHLGRIPRLDSLAERGRACAPAMRLDSAVTLAASNLEAGLALDSARVAPILASTIPQYRQRITAMVNQFCGARRRP